MNSVGDPFCNRTVLLWMTALVLGIGLALPSGSGAAPQQRESATSRLESTASREALSRASGSTAVDPDKTLTANDVRTIIAQAAAAAQGLGLPVTIAVVDHEGDVLGAFQMSGANPNTVIRGGGTTGQGLEGTSVPSLFAAISKAGTAAFFSTQGNAFTTLTAGFIIQEHFPPTIDFQAGGPLFGVQFSSLPCTDIKNNPPLPLGLSADPGGIPLYKNGAAAGGIGVEGDGLYTVDKDPLGNHQFPEEMIAVAGSRGFEAPAAIRGDQILVNGIRLNFENAPLPPATTVTPFSQLPGTTLAAPPPFGSGQAVVRDAQPSHFQIVNFHGYSIRVDPRFYPFRDSPTADPNRLLAGDVDRLLTQAIAQAFITRAAIRRPLNSHAEVNVAVVDAAGNVLGIVSTVDAPIFGFDVSAQKARTPTLYSGAGAAADMRAAGLGRYVDAAAQDGLALNGANAFTDRAGGFLSRPFFPDGINGTQNGPFSRPIGDWSVFNDGLQVDLVKGALFSILAGGSPPSCTQVSRVPNGIQIFPGSVPLYRNGQLIGGIGVSGDGVDQDDIIATMGSAGYEAPLSIRADQLFVRGVRLPYVKFPRHPDL